jgi:hypothetical protein
MKARLGTSLLALLRAADILLCTLWLAPLYVVGWADKPSGRQMISSYVGKAAENRRIWALVAEAVIDTFAVALGGEPYHCRRAYFHYRGLDQ